MTVARFLNRRKTRVSESTMTCRYCRALNAEYEHRCVRCARRLYDDPGSFELLPSYQPVASATGRYIDRDVVVIPNETQVRRTPPQERLPRHISAESFAYAQPAETAKSGLALALGPLTPRKKSPETPARQYPALETKIEAVIFSEAPTAHPLHRALAFSLDASLVTIAVG